MRALGEVTYLRMLVLKLISLLQGLYARRHGSTNPPDGWRPHSTASSKAPPSPLTQLPGLVKAIDRVLMCWTSPDCRYQAGIRPSQYSVSCRVCAPKPNWRAKSSTGALDGVAPFSSFLKSTSKRADAASWAGGSHRTHGCMCWADGPHAPALVLPRCKPQGGVLRALWVT